MRTRRELEASLQFHFAGEQRCLAELSQHKLGQAAAKEALHVLGVTVPKKKSRTKVLVAYLLDHPSEEVTNQMVREDPIKFGIITSSAAKLQLNWLYNKTARKLLVVEKGVIKLLPKPPIGGNP